MKNIVEKQRAFFNSNQTKEIEWRIQQLKKFRKVLKENEPLLYQAIYTDFQKSVFDTFANELSLIYSEIDETVQELKKWVKKKKVNTNVINFPSKSYIMPEPLGVTLVIGAWNYPFQLSLAPVIASISAGNTIILKPSEISSSCSKIMAQLINENFDPTFFKVIEGGIPETTELLTQRFDKIFFTGSVAVGKIISQAAAKYLTPVTLELGGKSPAIITEDCNLKTIVKRLIWAKFLNAGQTCVAPDYVLVHQSIEQRFLEMAKMEIEKEKFSIQNDNYVQIINTKNIHRLVNLLDKEKIYYGGKYDEQSRIFEPTLMHHVTFDDKVMQEEIFGPILPVIAYQSLDFAIAKIKEGENPLACYIFTSDQSIKNKILNEISFGGGAVNEAIMHMTNSKLPFGGVGESGMGSYHGENGFRTFSHYKSILEKPTWFELNLKYFPHTKAKLRWIKRLMGVK
ncbi:MAG: aldehyde dehydrogenase [Ignavibacteria bacterium]|nr:aldehyde dehydrogenase [Ignavibacteria bacterium]MBK8382304.1 aldehyde dehydrogenase [Ignavibacteria bacterium]